MKYIFTLLILALSLFAKDDASAMYHSCKFCHGFKGEVKYMNIVQDLKNMDAAELEAKLRSYKKGDLDIYGYGAMMKMQMKYIPEDKIPALAAYIEKL